MNNYDPCGGTNLRYINQLAIILVFWAGGELASKLIAPVVRFPGTVLGMLFLFIALLSGLIKEEKIEDTAEFFLSNIGFFFVPICVSLMTVTGLSGILLAELSLVTIISTVLTVAATAVTAQWVINRKGGKKWM